MGQSLKLECSGTTVRGVTTRVDMVFRSGGSNIYSSRMTATITMNNLLVYNNSYTISQLSTTDDGAMYECRLIIRVDPVLRVVDSISLDVTGKSFTDTWL